MSEGLKLTELEEYDQEVKRAHAENRAPSLRHPAEVVEENLGNSEDGTNLVRLTDDEQYDADLARTELHEGMLQHDETLKGVIRGTLQAGPTGVGEKGEGAVLPLMPADPSRHNPPKTDEQKELADRQTEAIFEKSKNFDDAFSDSNIPNVNDQGEVLGDSVNLRLTRSMQSDEASVHRVGISASVAAFLEDTAEDDDE